jgi:hypothetical protein
MFSIFAGEGAEWYDRQTLKTTLNVGKDGGKPQEMFEDYWGLVWRDRVAPNAEEIAQVRANAGVSSGPLFATGLIGLATLAFHQVGPLVQAIGGRFKYQVLWPPKSLHSGRRGYHTEVNAIVTNKASRAPDEAFELNYFWLSDELSRFVAINQPVMPPGRKWHRSKEVIASAPGMEIWGDVGDEAQKIGNDRHKWQGGTGASPKSLDWLNVVRPPILDVALTKGGDPRVALREAIMAGDRALA